MSQGSVVAIGLVIALGSEALSLMLTSLPFGAAAVVTAAAFALARMLPRRDLTEREAEALRQMPFARRVELIGQAQAMSSRGEFGLLLTLTERHLADNPNDEEVLRWKVEALIGLDRIEEAAQTCRAEFRPTMLDDRTDIRAWSGIFHELSIGSFWVEILSETQRLASQDWATKALADALAESERWAEMHTILDRVDTFTLTRDAHYHELYLQAVIRTVEPEIRIGNYTLADSILRKALDRMPGQPMFAKWLSRSLTAQGRRGEALELLYTSYRLSGHALAIEEAIRLLETGVEPPEILRALLRWMEQLEDDEALQYTVAWLLAKYGIVDEATKTLSQMNPPHAYASHAQRLLGEIHLRLRHYEQSASHLMAYAQALPLGPFIWLCRNCRSLALNAGDACPKCRSWAPFEALRFTDVPVQLHVEVVP